MKLTNKNLLLRWYTFNNLQICSADHTMTPDILAAMVFNDMGLNNMKKSFILSIDIVLMFRGFYAWISTLWRIFFFKKCTSCTYIYAMWNSLVQKLSACAIYHMTWYSLFCLMCLASATPFTKTFLFINWSKQLNSPLFIIHAFPYLESLNTFIAVHFQPQLYFVHP